MSFPKLFDKLNKIVGSTSSATAPIFTARSICTILSLTFQLQAACTVQLLDAQGAPISDAYTLPAGAIWSASPRLLSNNEQVQLALSGNLLIPSGGVTVSYEIIWQSGNCLEKITDHRNLFFFPQAENGDSSISANMPTRITVGNISSVILLAVKLARKEAIITNCGTTIIYLGLGGSVSNSAYHVALAACAAANDGTGGVFITDIWKGQIIAIGSAIGGAVNVAELT